MTQSFQCPCCGNDIGQAAPIEQLKELSGGFLSRGIIDELVKAEGKWVTLDSLADQIYQLRLDIPEDVRGNIRVSVSKLNKRIKSFGWVIKTPSLKAGGRYVSQFRLSPIETRVGA